MIRQADLYDLPQIQALFLDTVNSICEKDYNRHQLKAIVSSAKNSDHWIEKVTAQYFLVAQLRNQLVGFGSLDKGACIDALYVHKDFQRKGIAAKIFSLLERESHRVGTRILTSQVTITGRPFFESHGFSVVGEDTRVIDSTEIYRYRMSKVQFPAVSQSTV